MCDSRQVLRNLFTVLRCHLGSAGEGQPRSSSCLPQGSSAFSNCARPPAHVAGWLCRVLRPQDVSGALSGRGVPSARDECSEPRSSSCGTTSAPGIFRAGRQSQVWMPIPARPEWGPRRRHHRPHPSPGCSQRPASATPTWPLTRNWGDGPRPSELNTQQDSNRHLVAPLRGAGSGRSEMAAAAAAGSRGSLSQAPLTGSRRGATYLAGGRPQRAARRGGSAR